MDTALSTRRYRFGLALAHASATAIGPWLLAAYVLAQAANAALRLTTDYGEDLTLFLFVPLPFLLTVAAFLHMQKAFRAAITAGMTRRELAAGFAVYGGLAVTATAAYTQLIFIVHDLTGGVAVAELYGAEPLESLTRSAVYFAGGAAAGAVVARLGLARHGAALAGLLFSALVFRQFALSIIQSGYFQDGTVMFSIPAEEPLLAPLDAALAAAFLLIAWAALARAPLPQRKG